MSTYKYAVFGAGRQGAAAIYDLVCFCEAQSVLVVEPDAERLQAVGKRLKTLLGRDFKKLDLRTSAVVADLKGLDVLISAAPYAANVALTKKALAAGVAFCDLGGNPETVAEQERLAEGRDIPVVPECGISPGLSNIVAVHFARTQKASEIHVRCGGLPLDPPDPGQNPLRYKLVFSAWGLISEYSGKVPVIRAGRVTSIPALGDTETFDPYHEASPTSNNSPQVIKYLAACGVKQYDYMTIRYNGHWELVRGWKSLGYLRGDHGRDKVLAATLGSLPELQYDPRKDRDKLILCVRASRQEGGVHRAWEYRIDVPADPRTKFSAMELTTSWGATIVAHHMASGRGKPVGFATPERFVDTAWVLAELEKRIRA